MKTIWKEKFRSDKSDDLFEEMDGPPRVVLVAAGLLLVFFLVGSIYLFVSGPFRGIEVVAPSELSEISVVLTDYQGTLVGLEKQRRIVRTAIRELGIAQGTPITLFAQSPFRMRPIDIVCRVGYILPLDYSLENLPSGVVQETIHPGKRLVVRVSGHGNFTGNKAYKAAVKALRPMGLAPDDGGRFEVKVRLDNRKSIEHWIPVR
ncbi:hypothetical protein K8S19_10315 [bacterium]|nr:hypothetical protein [bacterium]